MTKKDQISTHRHRAVEKIVMQKGLPRDMLGTVAGNGLLRDLLSVDPAKLLQDSEGYDVDGSETYVGNLRDKMRWALGMLPLPRLLTVSYGCRPSSYKKSYREEIAFRFSFNFNDPEYHHDYGSPDKDLWFEIVNVGTLRDDMKDNVADSVVRKTLGKKGMRPASLCELTTYVQYVCFALPSVLATLSHIPGRGPVLFKASYQFVIGEESILPNREYLFLGVRE